MPRTYSHTHDPHHVFEADTIKGFTPEEVDAAIKKAEDTTATANELNYAASVCEKIKLHDNIKEEEILVAYDDGQGNIKFYNHEGNCMLNTGYNLCPVRIFPQDESTYTIETGNSIGGIRGKIGNKMYNSSLLSFCTFNAIISDFLSLFSTGTLSLTIPIDDISVPSKLLFDFPIGLSNRAYVFLLDGKGSTVVYISGNTTFGVPDGLYYFSFNMRFDAEQGLLLDINAGSAIS